MNNQKTVKFITVGGVDVDGWDASVDFTSDAIEFPESIAWALVLGDYNLTPGTPTITVEAAAVGDGTDWVEYKAGSTAVNISTAANRCVQDDTFPPRFFRVKYTSSGTTGDFTLRLSK